MSRIPIKAQRYCDLGLPDDVKDYKILIKSTKISAKWPEGLKTASQQKSLQNLSKSALYAHTLHKRLSQNRFPIKKNAYESRPYAKHNDNVLGSQC